MFKNIITIALCGSFISFFFSCYTFKYIPQNEVKQIKNEKAGILAIQKETSEYITFFKHNLGILNNGIVNGKVKQKVNIKIELSRRNVRHIVYDTYEGNTHIKTKEGKLYRVADYRKDRDNVYIDSLYEFITVSVPVSEIGHIKVKQLDVPATLGFSCASACILTLGILGLKYGPLTNFGW